MRFSKIIFTIIYVVFCFGLMNVAIYWATENFADSLQQARRILDLDSELGWKVKANLKTEFKDHLIHTDRFGFRNSLNFTLPEEAEVLLLGPSSAFGWGVSEEKTYFNLIIQRLRHLKGLNASQIGYTSKQGLLLVDHFHFPKAKNVILAYGVNDIDHFRFYGQSYDSDESYFQKPISISFFEEFLNSLAMGRLFQRFYDESRFYTGCGLTSIIQTRVSFADFKKNIQKIVHAFNPTQTKFYMVSTPFELPKKYEEKTPRLRNFDYEENYRKSYEQSQEGRCRESRRILAQTRAQEPYRIERDIIRLNEVIRSLSEELRIEFVDAHRELLQNGTEQNFFYDPVHPNNEGHRLIADRLYEKMSFYEER